MVVSESDQDFCNMLFAVIERQGGDRNNHDSGCNGDHDGDNDNDNDKGHDSRCNDSSHNNVDDGDGASDRHGDGKDSHDNNGITKIFQKMIIEIFIDLFIVCLIFI